MRRNKVRRLPGVTALLAVLAVLVVPGSSGAQVPVDGDRGGPHPAAAQVERRPAIATFEGQTLNLAESWGEARACLVWRQGGILECFRTAQALEARAAQLRPSPNPASTSTSPSTSTFATASSSWSCSSSLQLFDYNYYGGRQLSFWDRGFWQNLEYYGFDNRTSSYAVGGCYAHLAEHPHGAGWWYPGPTYPYAGEPVMSWSWQNVISSIYIE